MKKVYIPTDFFQFSKEQDLSPLVRPFYDRGKWQLTQERLLSWGLSDDWRLASDVVSADLVLFPGDAHHYFKKGHSKWLIDLCTGAHLKGIPSCLLITGDFGERFEDVPGLVYFRLGGFASQLSTNNKGFPFMLSDHMQRLFETEDIAPLPWQPKPLVGFCGHASASLIKAGKEKLKFMLENLRRFVRNPLRSDYEPLFSSARERWKLLQSLEQSPQIQTNFIYRKHYRAGARTPAQLEASTLEYYQNLRQSAYVLCVRGGGNFSVRLYETLMMGRIPVFVNTDCLLPFPEHIPWKKHMVWVEWEERHRIAEKILEFHCALGPDQFVELQLRNRGLWKDRLTLGGIFSMILDEISK